MRRVRDLGWAIKRGGAPSSHQIGAVAIAAKGNESGLPGESAGIDVAPFSVYSDTQT